MKPFFLSLIITVAVILLVTVAIPASASKVSRMAPVAQHLTDKDISYTYISDERGVFVTIFTKDNNWKAAPTCELLNGIGPVTKVTIWYEIEEPTTETVITEEAGNITISAVSVDSAVCKK